MDSHCVNIKQTPDLLSARSSWLPFKYLDIVHMTTSLCGVHTLLIFNQEAFHGHNSDQRQKWSSLRMSFEWMQVRSELTDALLPDSLCWNQDTPTLSMANVGQQNVSCYFWPVFSYKAFEVFLPKLVQLWASKRGYLFCRKNSRHYMNERIKKRFLWPVRID